MVLQDVIGEKEGYG